MPLSFTLNKKEQSWLLNTARLAIENALGNKDITIPEPETTGADPEAACSSPLLRDLGSFVTLSIDGRLRGCIGSIIGHEPLWMNIWRMARAAALEDPRFPPLSTEELEKIEISISVLDELSPCPDISAIEVGKHGLLLQYAGRSAVFLPQVPLEQGWGRTAYLENLCRKAGLPKDCWQQPAVRLYWYEAFVFGKG